MSDPESPAATPEPGAVPPPAPAPAYGPPEPAPVPAPAYGPPQPATATPYYYAPRTNPAAIVALILGLLVAPGGIIAGHIALSQIRRTGEGGRGMAIAGLILGYVITGFWVLYFVFVFVFLFFALATASAFA